MFAKEVLFFMVIFQLLLLFINLFIFVSENLFLNVHNFDYKSFGFQSHIVINMYLYLVFFYLCLCLCFCQYQSVLPIAFISLLTFKKVFASCIVFICSLPIGTIKLYSPKSLTHYSTQ